jgi:isopentenyl-diphosphate Delta-isomerase
MDKLILVDLADRETGTSDKMYIHQNALLHRAFSVFLYKGFSMLIQKRAAGKYHSAGLWANTCCSHPQEGELLSDAVTRRLREEVNICCKTTDFFSFVYFHRFSPDMAEYEYDHVFVGSYEGSFQANHDEIAEMEWVNIDILADDMAKHPDTYAIWFLSAAPQVFKYIADQQNIIR